MSELEDFEIIEVVPTIEQITDDIELCGAKKEIRNARTVIIPENPFADEEIDAYPPMRFSWVIPRKLAAMALPRNKENLQYLVNEGITRLITLSEEKDPPKELCSELKYSKIPVPEYQLPTLEQIDQFMDLCKSADDNEHVIGIHCRQGRSRSGVMLACYLIHFHRLSWEQACRAVREMRKGSLESEEHEEIVKLYSQHLQKDNPITLGVAEEIINQLIESAKV